MNPKNTKKKRQPKIICNKFIKILLNCCFNLLQQAIIQTDKIFTF